MCGISFFITSGSNSYEDCDLYSKYKTELEEALRRRGPDGYSCMVVRIRDDCTARVDCSVLWTQGCRPTEQPLLDASGGVLLWNGDIFAGELARGDGRSDTEVLSAELSSGSFLEVMPAVRGPYSVAYWDPRAGRLWFGRDRLGRHSLLLLLRGEGAHQVLGVTSVACRGLQGLDRLCLYPWSDVTEDELVSFREEFAVGCAVSRDRLPSPVGPAAASEPAEGELLAVSLASSGLAPAEVLGSLLRDGPAAARAEELAGLLGEAVRARVSLQPGVCRACTGGACGHARTAVLFSGGLDSAVLARLAHDHVPPGDPIDLLNVAFERPRRPAGPQGMRRRRAGEPEAGPAFDVPDRRTGRETLRELRKNFPQRQWNFVEINVSLSELNEQRERRIGHLIHPRVSVLDDSLGCALWFASRGEGLLEQPGGELANYTSPARVLLLGMGADEQLGGYARHRTTLRRGGWQGLLAELRLELARISSRNLGRDDRVAADHGRQARLPYLDEGVVSFLAGLPPWHRCCPVEMLPSGYGDKTLLRLTALKLGLSNAAFLPKRAFQFGSRIANSKEKATDVSHRL
ncbi:asparagine synthetase domain-containing protein 1 isoform X2 [Bacillus rossius redtenbacheri]|uniref:asparagine synthetase domain-containing protein 1 isoform X2 n=1 Tax=Bacillus rossius redtenbacheri TaxID=93214 RepID=UPI002FDD246B